MQEKQDLRRKMMRIRDEIPVHEREYQSIKVCNEVKQLIIDQCAKTVHSYLPMGREVNILPLLEWCLENEIRVYSPKTLPDRELKHYEFTGTHNLANGVFGTRYPVSDKDYKGMFDIIIVPGLAFTKDGKRLGYGGGYYDSFLIRHKSALSIGVCYFEQVLEDLPTEKHDYIQKMIVFEKK